MRKTRGGWGERGRPIFPAATAPFPKSCASYFGFARFNTFPLYYLRAWHRLARIWILLRIPAARILWDFNFLRGLAPDLLDGFSIGRYEKKRDVFDLFAVKFESRAMPFYGEKNAPALEPFQNKDSSLVLQLLGTVNGELKLLQNCSKKRFWGKRTTIYHR